MALIHLLPVGGLSEFYLCVSGGAIATNSRIYLKVQNEIIQLKKVLCYHVFNVFVFLVIMA